VIVCSGIQPSVTSRIEQSDGTVIPPFRASQDHHPTLSENGSGDSSTRFAIISIDAAVTVFNTWQTVSVSPDIFRIRKVRKNYQASMFS